MKSKRTPAAEVRSLLTAAAHRVLARDGERGLTVRAVAAEAGVAPMGVYNHFDGKDGLLVEVIDDGFRRLGDQFRGREVDAMARFRQSGYRYRQFAIENPTIYRMMFSGKTRATTEVALGTFMAMVDVITYGQAAGVIRADDPVALTLYIWSTVHGAVSLELEQAAPPFMDPADSYEGLLDFIARATAP
ncbi:TetR/AcrR family transcriptional regulator [Millisia brevis]|uniref:TetR/AcrR family transcriptional regulator n=1 Tax=Millisia brevis TaxID=264148 RepID=UPI000836A161|nr:TetR/AcrR family transcriptional regulator [Millisia brevis]